MCTQLRNVAYELKPQIYGRVETKQHHILNTHERTFANRDCHPQTFTEWKCGENAEKWNCLVQRGSSRWWHTDHISDTLHHQWKWTVMMKLKDLQQMH